MADDEAISFLDCFAFATLGLAMTRLVEVLLELNCYSKVNFAATMQRMSVAAELALPELKRNFLLCELSAPSVRTFNY